MKKCLIIFVVMICIPTVFAQNVVQKYEIDTTRFSKKYYHLKSLFESLPNKKKEIVFLGNSITEQGNWAELFNNKRVVNRGIGGDRTDGILYRLKEVTESKPAKVFLLIGTNDIRYGRSVKYIVDRNQLIIKKIKEESPKTIIYLQSLLPTYNRTERPIEIIRDINLGFQKIAKEENVVYIDLFSNFTDSSGYLEKKYSLDGLHLNGLGYQKWKTIIEHLL